MISAEVAFRPKVMGMNSAMPPIGPSPGRIPTKVPTSAPITQYARFCAVSAVAKPPSSSCSDSSISETERAGGHRDAEPAHEDEMRGHRGTDRDQHARAPADAEHPEQAHHEDQRGD